MSTDKEPILYRPVFGGMRPATPAAQDQFAGLDPKRSYRVDIKGIRGNTRRLALYWICLKLGCEQLSDAVDGKMSPRILHRYLKRRCGLSSPIISKKTGEIIDWDDESIAFENMPENERAAYIDDALAKLSEWIGCDVTTLRSEAQAQFGEAA
jgi:hypothetical protein